MSEHYYEYDTFGRLTKKILPYDSAAYPTKETFYDFEGTAPERVVVKERKESMLQGTYDSYFFYDGFGRPIQSRAEADNGQQATKETSYDGNGRVSYKGNPYFAAFNESYSPPENSVAGILYKYDALGRTVNATNPDNSSKKFVFDRGIVYVYDEEKRRKDYATDGFGRVVQVTEYNDNEIYNTTYAYDAADNLLSITDNENNAISYVYDTLGRKTKVEDPNIGIWMYSFDDAGNLVNQTSGNNIQAIMSYDAIGRVIRKESAGGSINYSYDKGRKGTLSQVNNSLGSVSFSYDDRLRITEKSENYDGILFSTYHSYDALNRVTQTVQPDSTAIHYTYNNQSLTAAIATVLSEIEYNAAGMPSRKSYANGLASEYSYHPTNFRVSKIKTAPHQDFEYEYDLAGNVKAINDLSEGTLYSMTYDDLDRLTSADRRKAGMLKADYTFIYEYDPLGNIVETMQEGKKKFTYKYAAKPVHAPSLITYNGPVPVFEEIGSKSVSENQLLEFTVSASYDGNDKLSYSSSELPENANFDAASGKFRWKPDFEQSGSYYITFSVSDSMESDSEKVAVKVTDTNRPPMIEQFSPDPSKKFSVEEGLSISFEVDASDADGDAIKYVWKLDGLEAATTHEYTYYPKDGDSGDHFITITVRDGKSATDSKEISVKVLDTLCLAGQTRPCQVQTGVCSGSIQLCSVGKWNGCSSEDYGAAYEPTEKTCDSIDNDCDGSVDEYLSDLQECASGESVVVTCIGGQWTPATSCFDTAQCGESGQQCCGGSLCYAGLSCYDGVCGNMGSIQFCKGASATSAGLFGNVMNSSGDSVAEATITVAAKGSTQTDPYGHYEMIVPSADEGSPYDLTASHPEYGSDLMEGLTILNNQCIERNFILSK